MEGACCCCCCCRYSRDRLFQCCCFCCHCHRHQLHHHYYYREGCCCCCCCEEGWCSCSGCRHYLGSCYRGLGCCVVAAVTRTTPEETYGLLLLLLPLNGGDFSRNFSSDFECCRCWCCCKWCAVPALQQTAWTLPLNVAQLSISAEEEEECWWPHGGALPLTSMTAVRAAAAAGAGAGAGADVAGHPAAAPLDSDAVETESCLEPSATSSAASDC
mmetsp:Transcript_42143/g.85238  ORF Transcript_42143/g.85238 Transcript_42143/m.85238 type:complete len:215 (-) Transcript_42143:512-1156(-)